MVLPVGQHMPEPRNSRALENILQVNFLMTIARHILQID